ncbi:ribosomal protection-like ABC-F family protein [Lentilactobacillus sp. Marseille-Q4993]|uniref:ribosomal protection-like ABC-F family protein n=1 Tax=Lentilactobacillus sp. Marseille-Q4993 TaxID=3039492 RepID=UPI0024BC91DC|nr:ATP-binding cassette domain-containing protein [Lentilactobacillus sp. Marseille-Q4993]
MGMININNLSFRYDGMQSNLFNKLNISIDESWKLGLIGRNGRGKTTLMRILLGQLEYIGDVQSNLKFHYFPQAVISDADSAQNVVLKMAGIDISELWRIQIEMDKLQLKDTVLNQQFSTLSPGEKTKLKLAVLFSDENTFKLIDEPTNHLDVDGRKIVADYLKQKTGFIVVSHDRDLINKVVDHVMSIDRSKVEVLKGDYDTWKVAFDQQNEFEKRKKAEIEGDVKRLEKAAKRVSQWGNNTENKKGQSAYKGQGHVDLDKGFIGHKAAKVMKRKKVMERRTDSEIEEKKSLLKNIDEEQELTLNFSRTPQKNLLTVSDFTVSRSGHQLIEPISFKIGRHDRVAIMGPNGIGKTTVIRAILGDESIETQGTSKLAGGLKISYVGQLFDNVNGDLREYAESNKLDLSLFLNALRKLGFDRSVFDNKMEDMSMGQKRKISLAKSLVEPANLYVWDEPLNYLDIITRQEIENLVLEVKPPMLFIDHDVMFVRDVATEKITLRMNSSGEELRY